MRSIRGLFKRVVVLSCVSVGLGLFGGCSSADEDIGDSELPLRAQCTKYRPCPQPGAPCRICADGSLACPSVDCIKHQCVFQPAECPPGCLADSDCVQPLAPCKLCPDGSSACPSASCVNGQCVAEFPECKPFQPCAGKSCGDRCQICPPNAPDCFETQELKFCQTDGTCSSTTPVCSEKVFCGGIAAFPCPGAGTCVDDPSDDCNPLKGGADCGGMCVCQALALCAPSFRWDSSPSVCGCVPDGVSTGIPCGNNVCGAGQFCCNESCGICAPKGGACIQIFCGASDM